MARGIEVPTKAVNGRLKLLSGDGYIRQLVETMLDDGDSENPFQDLPMREDMIFQINDSISDGLIKEKIKKGFAILERDQLARYVSLKFISENEVKKIIVKYENLETGERPEIEVPIPD